MLFRHFVFSVKFAFSNLHDKKNWEVMSSSIKTCCNGRVGEMRESILFYLFPKYVYVIFEATIQQQYCNFAFWKCVNILNFKNVSTFCILKMCQYFAFWKCVIILHFENVSTFCILKMCQHFATVAIQHKVGRKKREDILRSGWP